MSKFIAILSPAKTLDMNCVYKAKMSDSRLSSQTKLLASKMKKYSSGQLAKLMKISNNLSQQNIERWRAFGNKKNETGPAVFCFQGQVYKGLDVSTFDKKTLDFTQDCIRILSGLYGLLRPLDKIQAYRLEIGTVLKTDKGKNLYEFWGNKIVKNIVSELKKNKSDLIINLASQEYFKVVKDLDNKTQVISPVFKDYKNGTYKIISFYAKKARGLMARYIVLNKVTTPKGILNFNLGGYKYSQQESSPDAPVFLRKS